MPKPSNSNKYHLLTPISHLFNDPIAASQIASASDYLEGRERTITKRFSKTSHYHIDFDLNIGLSDEQLDFLARHIAEKEEAQVVTFQVARDCERVQLLNGAYQPTSQVISFKEQLENVRNSLKQIRKILGTDIEIGVENNNYYPTGAYDICSSADFLRALIEENDLHLLFDIAHAKVTCKNRNIDYASYKNQLLELDCRQIHLCEPLIPENSDALALDSHKLPTTESILEADNICTTHGIRYLTIEYYKDVDLLLDCLNSIRDLRKNDQQ